MLRRIDLNARRHMTSSPTAAAADRRLWEIDALRGLMLLLMSVTHIPTRFTDPLGQPFGFVSAAEGFVLLSGFMAGLVYTQKQLRRGDEAMRDAFLKRAFKIYLAQAALLLFVLTVVALIGVATRQEAITDLVSYFLEQPLKALLGGLLLLYNPPLLDILPMYVLFMIASPVLLLHGSEHGWRGILAASVALWLAAQFGMGVALYEAFAALTGLAVPLQQTGAFEWLAWQLLWVIGLWIGAEHAAGRPVQPSPFPPWTVAAAVAIALLHLVWRHALGQAPFGANVTLNALYDKWSLGPLRLIDLFAMIVVCLHFGPHWAARLPRPKALELLGRQSLPVFCAHVVLAMLVLAFLGPIDPERPWLVDVALLTACFALLFTVALTGERIDREAARGKERIKALRARRRGAAPPHRAPAAAPDGVRSPGATAGSRPG
jgi:hypothetical protein